MNDPRFRATIHWLPRVLGIMITIFVAMFALDIFSEGYGFWETILAFIIHLAPFTGVLALAVLLGWRWPRLGGLLFIGFGLGYLIVFWGHAWEAYALLTGIPVIIGVLFIFDAFLQQQFSMPSIE